MSQATFLNRQALYLRPDPARVVVRPFKPATEPRDLNPTDKTRANHIVDRVLALDPEAAASQLADVLENFQGRHRNLLETFEAAPTKWKRRSLAHCTFSEVQRQLVGAYFLNEYSFEASALFNPSIVPHPDQSGAPKGGLRFILSLRAVGEGHVSSLTFRSGTIAADGSVTVDPTARLASSPRIEHRTAGPIGDEVEVVFKPEEDISERVIFPVTASQSNGIEDARFVEFNDGGRKTYYATYTAYSGRAIRSELIETSDFLSFRMSPLHGAAARNKGMALFPRKIDGKYAMIARQDNENLYLIYSDDLYTLGWRSGDPEAAISLGVRADRQLRIADRAGRGLAAADPRRRPGAEIFDRRGAARQERSVQGAGAFARAAGAARAVRARRLCPQRRLYLRGDGAQRSDHPALRGLRHLLQLRDDQDCRADAGDVLNTEVARCGLHTSKESPMARETSYFVQAFNAGRGGNLKADAPIACKTETGALRTAERLALSKLGRRRLLVHRRSRDGRL